MFTHSSARLAALSFVNLSFLLSFLPSYLFSFLPSFFPFFLSSFLLSFRTFVHSTKHPSSRSSRLPGIHLIFLNFFLCSLLNHFLRCFLFIHSPVLSFSYRNKVALQLSFHNHHRLFLSPQKPLVVGKL